MYESGSLTERLRRVWRRIGRWIPALGLAAAAVILGTLAWRDREALWHAVNEAQPGWLAAAFVVFSVDLLLVIAIWAHLLRALGVTLPFREHVSIYAQSNAGKRLPGTLWYVASRVSLYERCGVPAATVAMASGMEFALSFTTSAVFGLVTVGDLLWTQVLPHVVHDIGAPALAAAGVVLASASLVVLIAGRRLMRRRFGEAFQLSHYRLKAPTILGLAGAYAGVWLLGGIFLLCITLAFAPALSIGQMRLTIGAWALSSMLATLALLLPSSLGVKELTVGALLGAALPASTAVLTALLARLLATGFDFAWSAAVMVAKGGRRTADGER
jgi:uncharacterized membrane protein YbhN (UPF0104 family)